MATKLDEAVEVALRARVPGGAAVKDWLPSADDRGEVPHEVAVSVVRAALLASLPVLLGPVVEAWREMANPSDPMIQSASDCADDLESVYALSLGEGDGL